MKQSLLRAGLLSLLLLQSACASAQEAAPVAELRRICSDAGVRWFERPGNFDRLLVLGVVEGPELGPATTPEIPYTHFGMPALKWLRATPVIYIYVAPKGALPDTLFSPEPNEPAGVYQLEVVDAPDPRCARYERHVQALSRAAGSAFSREVPGNKCIRYEYKGPLRISEYQFVRLSYVTRLDGFGDVKRVDSELRGATGAIVARGRQYLAPKSARSCVSPPPHYPEDLL